MQPRRSQDGAPRMPERAQEDTKRARRRPRSAPRALRAVGQQRMQEWKAMQQQMAMLAQELRRRRQEEEAMAEKEALTEIHRWRLLLCRTMSFLPSD